MPERTEQKEAPVSAFDELQRMLDESRAMFERETANENQTGYVGSFPEWDLDPPSWHGKSD